MDRKKSGQECAVENLHNLSLRAPHLILRLHRKENSPLMSLRRSAATAAISILPLQKPSIFLGGPKGCGNLLRYMQKNPSLRLRLLRFARNDKLRPNVFYKAGLEHFPVLLNLDRNTKLKIG